MIETHPSQEVQSSAFDREEKLPLDTQLSQTNTEGMKNSFENRKLKSNIHSTYFILKLVTPISQISKQSKSISALLNQRFIEPYLNISNSDFWLLVQQAVSAQIHILSLGSVIGFQIAVNHRIAWNIEEYDWKTLIRSFPSIWAFTVQLRPWDFSHECVSVC